MDSWSQCSVGVDSYEKFWNFWINQALPWSSGIPQLGTVERYVEAFGEGIMSATVQRFTEGAVRIAENVNDGTKTDQTAYILLPPSCATLYVEHAV